MAVSIAKTSETANLVPEYNEEKVSLVSFLPSHTLSRLPIFENVAILPQQNGNVANKNIYSFNKRNSFPCFVPRNSSFTNCHGMCEDLPLQQINSSSRTNRRRAASFGENSFVRSNNNNNNNNDNTTTTLSLSRKPITPLIIHIPSKIDKIRSPREKHSPKEKSSSVNSPISSSHNLEQEQENNKIQEIEIPNDSDQNRELSSDKSNTCLDYVQNNENQNDHIENSQLNNNNNNNSNSDSDSNPNSNSQSQSQLANNRAFFRHTVTLNNNESTNLRKSIYKEPSFKKKLRKVFSLSNVSTSNSRSSPSDGRRFSSLRGKKHNFNDNNDNNSSPNNNDDKDDVSVSSVSSNGENIPNNDDKTGIPPRRRSFIDLQSLFKYNKQNRHQKQPPDQRQGQKKRFDDNKRNDSADEIGEDQIGNGNERIDGAFIPLRVSSLPSVEKSSDQVQHQNSTSPLYNQFPINKSENLDDKRNSNSSSRPFSLPAFANDKETAPRRSSVPASIIKPNNDRPFVNLGANETRSVPSLVLLKDTDVPPAPSTPSSIKKLQFSSTILIHETWTCDDYDRRGDQSTCNKLTPIIAQRIKQELNEYKSAEMQVHEESRNNTHYFAE